MPKENLREADYLLNRYYFRPIGARLVPVLARTPVTPNQLTIVAFVVGLASAFSFWKGQHLVGAVLIHLQVVLDVCDGGLARYKGMTSRFGAILDATLDTALWFILFVGLALGTGTGPCLLIGVCATLAIHLAVTRYFFPNTARSTPRERWFNRWFVRRKLRLGFDELTMLVLMSVLAPFGLIEAIFWVAIVGRNLDWVYRLIETRPLRERRYVV